MHSSTLHCYIILRLHACIPLLKFTQAVVYLLLCAGASPAIGASMFVFEFHTHVRTYPDLHKHMKRQVNARSEPALLKMILPKTFRTSLPASFEGFDW